MKLTKKAELNSFFEVSQKYKLEQANITIPVNNTTFIFFIVILLLPVVICKCDYDAIATSANAFSGVHRT